DEVVKGAVRILVWPVRQLRWRIEAEHDEVGALERHDAISLRPAAVVANRHSDCAPECFPDGKAKIAVSKIELLEVLERQGGVVDRAAWHMDLAVFPDDPTVPLDQDRCVEAPDLAGLFR